MLSDAEAVNYEQGYSSGLKYLEVVDIIIVRFLGPVTLDVHSRCSRCVSYSSNFLICRSKYTK